jgi:hypothetical protein
MTIDFKLVESRMACITGEPSLVFWDIKSDIVIQICPTPMIGMDMRNANSLCYPIMVIAPKGISSEDLAEMIATTLGTFDFEGFDDALVGSEKIAFQIAVDISPREQNKTLVYHAVASVIATDVHIARMVTLQTKQLQAYEKILAAQTAMPVSDSSNIH